MAKVFNLLYNNEKNKKYIIFFLFFAYCVFGILQTSVLYDVKWYSVLTKSVFLLVALVLCFYLFFDFIKKKIKISWFLIFGVVTALGVLIFVHDTILCFLIAFLYLFKNYDFKEITRVAACSILFAVVINVFLALSGIISNQVHYRDSISRMTFGFETAVLPAIYTLCFCVAYNFSKGKEVPYIFLVFEFCFSLIFFHFTNTRGAFILTIFVIAVALLLKLSKYQPVKNFFNKFYISKERKTNLGERKNRIFSFVFASLPILFTIGFGICTYLYQFQSDFILKLNSLLSNRLQLTYDAFESCPISLFGTLLEWYNANGEYIGVDMAFYHYYFNWGVISFVFVLIYVTMLFYKAVRTKRYYLCFMLFVMLLDALIDSCFMDVRYNVLILSFAMLYDNLLTVTPKNIDKELVEIEGKLSKETINKHCLSIIIPVYNAETFIETCLKKVLNIKLNKEIIVINDASTDETLKQLDKFKDKIQLIDLKENRGVSNARNIGLKVATGDYITFIDVDDDFENDMHVSMMSKIIKEDADLCVCNYYEINNEGKDKIKSKYKFDNKLASNDYVKNYLNDKVSPAVWDKIYKKEIINEISFNNQLKIGEDILFNCLVALKVKKVVYIDKPLYYYVQHKNSTMHNLSDKFLDFLKVCDYISPENDKILKMNYSKEYDSFNLEMITRGIHSISSNVNKFNKKIAIDYLKIYCTKSNLKNIIKNDIIPKFIRIECMILFVFGIKVHLFFFPIYVWARSIKRN